MKKKYEKMFFDRDSIIRSPITTSGKTRFEYSSMDCTAITSFAMSNFFGKIIWKKITFQMLSNAPLTR